MWPKNAITERLGLEWPIIQAPMAGASSPELAAAVSNAGGLGSSASAPFPPRRGRADDRLRRSEQPEPQRQLLLP